MQGYNMGRYRPPSPTSSPYPLQKPHPLGSRASKLASHGILTVRFEMPFPIWCASCLKPTIIGQGVRFNAQKKKVGNYYTTAIWSFVMKHADCGGEVEIRTDPAKGDYVVVSGGRRRDVGKGEEGDLVGVGVGVGEVVLSEREKEERREGAMGRLERGIEAREREREGWERLGELRDLSERQWENPYERNRRLRRGFRKEREGRETEGRKAEEVKERYGLGMELLPGTEEDERRAGLVDFGEWEGEGNGLEKVLARPLFERVGEEKKNDEKKGMSERKLKSEIAAEKLKESLVSEIVGNTRAARDPFLGFGSKDSPKGPVRLPGLKRKRPAEETPDPPVEEPTVKKGAGAAIALVSYGSDSE